MCEQKEQKGGGREWRSGRLPWCLKEVSPDYMVNQKWGGRENPH